MLRFGTLILISIVFTKTSLTTSEIGGYEIFLFLSGLLCSFWVSGLIQSFLPLFQDNKAFAEKKGSRSPELFNLFLLLTVFSLASILALLLFKKNIETTFNRSSEIQYFGLLMAYIFFSSPSFLTEYIYLLLNKPASMLKYGISTFIAQLLFISIPAVLGWGMFYCLAGLVAITLVRYAWLLLLLKKYAGFKISPAFIREHLHFGFPLVASTLLGSSAQYVDGFLVMSRYDPATFAIFQYGAREFPLVLLMANAFSTAMIPEFSKEGDCNESLRKLREKSGRLMHWLFPPTMVLLFFSNWLYPLVFNENFSDSAGIFNIYLLLIISRLVFPQSILIGFKKTRIIMVASVIELTVNILFSLFFMQLWGIEGVAFGTLLAHAAQKLVWLAYLKRKMNINPEKYIPLRIFTTYSLILALLFVLKF